MIIEDDILHEVNLSFDRCSMQGAFFDKLCRNFKAAHVPIPAGMNQQPKLMKEDLSWLVSNAGSSHPDARAGAVRMHVPPQLSKIWVDVLMKTLREFDAKFSPELERKWRFVLNRTMPPPDRIKFPA